MLAWHSWCGDKFILLANHARIGRWSGLNLTRFFSGPRKLPRVHRSSPATCEKDTGQERVTSPPERRIERQPSSELRSESALGFKERFTGNYDCAILTRMDEYEGSLDDVFSALAHPTRRKMLELLSVRKLCVTELADRFPGALNVASKHVKYLERAGLVKRRCQGRVHNLRLE